MSEDSQGYDINNIPDTRPLPSEIAARLIDGDTDNLSNVQRFAAAVGSMPPNVAYAICRAIGRLDSFCDLSELARSSGVSLRTLHRHIHVAATRSKKMGVSPHIGSPDTAGGLRCVRRGTAARVTNAANGAKNDETEEPNAG